MSLVLENTWTTALDSVVILEWLDANGSVQGSARQEVRLQTGKSTVDLALPLLNVHNPLLARLRYSVHPGAKNYASFRPLTGIQNLIDITDYAFAVRVISPGSVVPGKEFQVQVLTTHPVSGKPISNVAVTLRNAQGHSDANGIAVVHIASKEDDATISANGMAFTGDYCIPLPPVSPQISQDDVRITLDKPMYQPGQTVHMRILARKGNQTVRENAEYSLEVTDERGDKVFTNTLTTSRFGIAAADWELPAVADPGEYSVRVEDESHEVEATRSFTVRKYELPSFLVTVNPDRPYYLPGQAPQLEIKGEYLFGKPITQGSVRVVEKDSDESLLKGSIDASGQFKGSIALDQEISEFERFVDRHYIAFITDLSTNRTEQRKFDLRLSRDSLHVYQVKARPFMGGLKVYVTAYTPDGAPAEASITISAEGKTLGTGKTNRYGLARIEIQKSEAPELKIEAATATGERTSEVVRSYSSHQSLVIEPARLLHRPGDPIVCAISSSKHDLPLLVAAWNPQGDRVFSQPLHLVGGKAQITIPYDRRFGRRVTVAAISMSGTEEDARTVLFPGSDELKVRVVPEKAVYRPGDTAAIRFQTSQQAALGIAIIDQSVIERVATDQAFGKRWFSEMAENQPSLNGISESVLQSLPPVKINADLELAAEALVSDDAIGATQFNLAYKQRTMFVRQAAESLSSIAAQLQRHFLETVHHPRDAAELSAVFPNGVPLVRDPWLHSFRTKFETEGANDSLCFESAGADGKWETQDDFCALTIRHKWFANHEALIRDALRPLTAYPASIDAFMLLLESAGVRFGALRDRWGNALQLRMEYARDTRQFRIVSPGPDGRFETRDDVELAQFTGSYFREMKSRMDKAVSAASPFPQTVDQFRAVLSAAGIDVGSLRDPWGNPYSLVVNKQASPTRRIENYQFSIYSGPPEQRSITTSTPITLWQAKVRSRGPDGLKDTYDDFDVAVFTKLIEDSVSGSEANRKPAPPLPGMMGKGAMTGLVADQTGAYIPNVMVLLNDAFETRTDEQGWYRFDAVPEGVYSLTFLCAGFQKSVIADVPVKSQQSTRVDAVLQVGSVAEAVEVQSRSSLAKTSTADSLGPSATAVSTPRVREYFPETLFWQPELVTDSAGRASLKVKLADSITTWHVAVLGSTLDGQITETSAELKAFQPFQADLDVPRVLTAGDRIALPVPVRNYLDRAQKVAVTALVPRSLSLASPVGQPDLIQPSSSGNATLDVIAKAHSAGEPLRVTALSRDASDAIEKSVAVHPDGEPRELAIGAFASGKVTLRADVPSAAITDGIHAEIRIYPSVLSRVLESLESMLQRPTGCAEQTISSSYPNLRYLQSLQKLGLTEHRLQAKALKNLKEGYQKLLNYQQGNGGFSYWEGGTPDIAVTTYALQFLDDSKQFITMAEERIQGAQAWLAKQKPDDRVLYTMQIHALARASLLSPDAIDLWLGEMARNSALSGSSYALATFATAAMQSGKPDAAQSPISRLIAEARDERGAVYWGFREITPFHGWGYSGQVEVTSRVISALAKWRELGHGDASTDILIQRALLFLLRHASSRGGWSTTQATVAALDALMQTSLTDAGELSAVQIRANGAPAIKVAIPAVATAGGPITVDVSRFIRPGAANEFTVSAATGNLIQAQLNATWYEPWGAERQSKGMSLKTSFNTLSPAINQAVRCDIEVSRPLTAGYGMMIVEAGLPPGAEVDRGTLEDLLKDGKSAVDHYEVAPDRVIFYVWPRTDATAFRFTFRPRFSMKAKAAPSVAYDYYNPDERSVVAPATFTVAP